MAHHVGAHAHDAPPFVRQFFGAIDIAGALACVRPMLGTVELDTYFVAFPSHIEAGDEVAKAITHNELSLWSCEARAHHDESGACLPGRLGAAVYQVEDVSEPGQTSRTSVLCHDGLDVGDGSFGGVHQGVETFHC